MKDILESNHINSLLRKASNFLEEGKLLHSIQIYTILIENYPNEPEAYSKLCGIYQKIGKTMQAENILNRYISINETDDEKVTAIKLQLALLYIEAEKYDNAIDLLQTIQDSAPETIYYIGLCYYKLKDFEIAKIYFINFIDKSKISSYELQFFRNAFLFLIDSLLKLNDFELAIVYAKKADSIYSFDYDLNILLAECYFRIGMFEHASGPIEKAIRISPINDEAYLTASKIYLGLFDLPKAEKYILKYFDSSANPKDEAYTHAGNLFYTMQKYKEAEAYFDLALKLNPENEQALSGKNRLIGNKK